MHRIERVYVDDLRDLTDDYFKRQRLQNDGSGVSMEEASRGKQVLLDELQKSGIAYIDIPTVQLLPTWQQVAELYYPHAPPDTCEPIIFGMDRCRAFSSQHSTRSSFLATAGLYNTGTNALTYYLRANLQMKGNPLWNGILVQVPWHKHWFATLRETHSIPYLSNISLAGSVLPIVTIRDPLSWAQSMCKQPYDVEWVASGRAIAPPRCPSRVPPGDPSVRIPVQTGDQIYRDLFDVWNKWYSAYMDAAAHLNFVMVRHEDLIYCPRRVLALLQECSGANWTNDDASFVYVMDQAKWEHARLSGRAQSNRVSAMIKHGHKQARRQRHLSPRDFDPLDGSMVVNRTLMDIFGYSLPTWMD